MQLAVQLSELVTRRSTPQRLATPLFTAGFGGRCDGSLGAAAAREQSETGNRILAVRREPSSDKTRDVELMSTVESHSECSSADVHGRQLSTLAYQRNRVHNLTPVAMPNDQDSLERVVGLYNYVLPNIGKPFLRKYLGRDRVHTVLLLLPECAANRPQEPKSSGELCRTTAHASGTAVEEVRTSSSLFEARCKAEIERHERQPDEQEVGIGPDVPASYMPSQTFRDLGFHDGAEGAESDGEGGVESDGDDDDEEEEAENAGDSSPAASAPAGQQQRPPPELERIVGAISFETMSRYGQEIVQVSLLGVNADFQKLGVGSRLLSALFRGDATCVRPHAAITWADHSAVPFFTRHGFSSDAILCSRYRVMSEPWERSVLMAVQLPPPVCHNSSRSPGQKTGPSIARAEST